MTFPRWAQLFFIFYHLWKCMNCIPWILYLALPHQNCEVALGHEQNKELLLLLLLIIIGEATNLISKSGLITHIACASYTTPTGTPGIMQIRLQRAGIVLSRWCIVCDNASESVKRVLSASESKAAWGVDAWWDRWGVASQPSTLRTIVWCDEQLCCRKLALRPIAKGAEARLLCDFQPFNSHTSSYKLHKVPSKVQVQEWSFTRYLSRMGTHARNV